MREEGRRLIDDVLVALRASRVIMCNEHVQERLAEAQERGLRERKDIIAFVLGAGRKRQKPYSDLR